jgi:hypothetical protein
MSHVSLPDHFIVEINCDSSPLQYALGCLVHWIIYNFLQIISFVIELFIPTNAPRQFSHCFLYYYDYYCLGAFVGINNSIIKRCTVNIK